VDFLSNQETIFPLHGFFSPVHGHFPAEMDVETGNTSLIPSHSVQPFTPDSPPLVDYSSTC
jgi:hypothetical protein